MLNLTPHSITINAANGDSVTLAPSGVVARVTTTETIVGHDLGVDVIKRTFGEVENLPEEGVQCLVSAMVIAACPGREGVFAPDSGPTAVRNEKGQVVAVTRLVAA